MWRAYVDLHVARVHSLALLTISADRAVKSLDALAEETLGDQHARPVVQARVRVTRTCSDTNTCLFRLSILFTYSNNAP